MTDEELKKSFSGIREMLDERDKKQDERDKKLEAELGEISKQLKQLAYATKILQAKQANAAKGSFESLEQVLLADGATVNVEAAGGYPRSVMELAVCGSELVTPNTTSSLNSDICLNLIRQYDPGYASETDGSPDEVKAAKSSRRRRLKLASLIGVTPAQLARAAAHTMEAMGA